VAIVSHAYIEEELRKGIGALADKVQVTVVSPETAACLVFSSVNVRRSVSYLEHFAPIKTIKVAGAQYLFRSLDLSFRESRPDVVCVQYDPWSLMFWQTLVCCRLFARHAKIVCSVKKNTYRHGGGAGDFKYLITRLAMNYIDRFMAASEMTRWMYIDTFGVDGSMIEVITPIGVDADNFSPAHPPRPIDPGRAVIGYAGRLEPHKGIEDLIEAVEHCRSTWLIDLQLEVCGVGSLTGALEKLAQSRAWLSLRGLVPNGEVPDFLRGLDVFVLPARILPDHQEHDAHALLEALACGLPCIATRSGINTELLGDGTGLLVEPQRPTELSDAIRQLVRNVDRRRELSARARARALTDFDNHRLATRKADFFEKVRRGDK
jgi:glycosyltransferase involved in cell wall biosynthesis